MTEPIQPREWPAYWLMRHQLERQVEADVAGAAVFGALVDFLAEHCFGCGVQIAPENDEELCPACLLAQRWRLN